MPYPVFQINVFQNNVFEVADANASAAQMLALPTQLSAISVAVHTHAAQTLHRPTQSTVIQVVDRYSRLLSLPTQTADLEIFVYSGYDFDYSFHYLPVIQQTADGSVHSYAVSASALALPARSATVAAPRFVEQSAILALPRQVAGSVHFITANQLLPDVAQFSNIILGGYSPYVGLASPIYWLDSSGLERAVADADAERLVGIDAELIIDTWDPYACPKSLLPYLAWAMGVNYWNDDWSDQTKRNWIASQWTFKSLRGTVDGIAMVVDYAGRDVSPFGYVLTGVITQPQGLYPGPAVSAAARMAWLENLPQLRVYYYMGGGTAEISKFFCGSNKIGAPIAPNFFLEGTFDIPSVAKGELVRKAIWYGADDQPTDAEVNDLGTYYQVLVPGVADEKMFCNTFLTPGNGVNSYPQPSDAWKRVLTIEPASDAPYPVAVGPSLISIQSQPQKVAVPGTRGLAFYAGSDYYHGTGTLLASKNDVSDPPLPASNFFLPSTAKYRLYDAYYVIDPNNPPPANPASAVSMFMGVGRLGWPAFTAQANVWATGQRSIKGLTPGDILSPRDKFLIPHDGEPIINLCTAIEASRRLQDKILLKTGPFPTFVAGSELIAGTDNFVVGEPNQQKPASIYQQYRV